MKRRFYLIMLLAAVALSGMAQNVGDAFYIYRNDGDFNAFFRDEVQSIEYSYEDADGNSYDEIVTQIVTTADSVYMIPLAAIDSIGFVQPVPLYVENTIELSGQLVDYIISVEDMVITMRSDTPDNLLPKVGDKLAQLGFTNVFPNGFVGQVASVTRQDGYISVVCESLTIDDVVQKYYAVYRLDIVDDNSYQQKIRRAPSSQVFFDKTFPSATIPIHMDLEVLVNVWESETLYPDIGIGRSGDVQIDITPTLDIKVTYNRNDLMGVVPRYNCHVVTNFVVTEELQLMGIISGEKKWPGTFPPPLEALKDIPLVPGITFYWDAGIKVSGSGSLGVGARFEQQAQHVTDINIYPLLPPLIPPVSTVTQSMKVKGHDEEWLYFLSECEAKIGPYIELGFALINHHVSKIGAEFGAGGKIGGQVKFDPFEWANAETSTDFYDHFKDESKLTFDVYFDGSVFVSLLDDLLNVSLGADIDLKMFHKEANLFPSFSNVSLEKSGSNLEASANIENICIFPVQVGAALFNSQGSRIQTVAYGNNYWTPASFTNYSVAFTDVPMTNQYTTYPTVRLFGKDIIASPSAELRQTSCPDDNHPHMIDMGLPSGTKWACCNVGANSPEEYGAQYAWGETVEKDTYTWDNYQYGYYDDVNSHGVGLDIGVDISNTQYDVARVRWGEPWRMPTKTQYSELLNYEYVKKSTETLNGVQGYLFTSKINGNKIFLPSQVITDVWGGVRIVGAYWTSSIYDRYVLDPTYSEAWTLVWTIYYMESESAPRCNGRSVRPVSE